MEFGHGPFWKDFLFMLMIGATITIIRSIYQNSKKKHQNENKHNHGGTVRNKSNNKTVQKYIERLISTHEDRKKPRGPEGKDVPEELKGKSFSVGIYSKGEYSWNFSELDEQFPTRPS